MLAPVLGLGMLGASVLLSRGSQRRSSLSSVEFDSDELTRMAVQNAMQVLDSMKKSMDGNNCRKRHEHMISAVSQVAYLSASHDFVLAVAPNEGELLEALTEVLWKGISKTGAVWSQSCMKDRGRAEAGLKQAILKTINVLQDGLRKNMRDLDRPEPPPTRPRRAQPSYLKLVKGGKKSNGN
jgi:hypothetical protein